MVRVTLEVPEDVAEALKQMEAKLRDEATRARAFQPVDPEGAFSAIEHAGDALKLSMKRRLLQDYDADEPRLLIGGRVHARVGRYEATFKALQGPVKVTRSLYREAGKRNSKTLDAVSARTGTVADGWLPETARAMAQLLSQGTSREAEQTAKALRVLPYSRSSFERIPHEVAGLFAKERNEVESRLIEAYEVPPAAVSVSVSLDRVSVPMEEPRIRPPGRPRKKAAKRPIERNYRMAYCATICLHDANGETIDRLCHGRMPKQDIGALGTRLREEVLALRKKKPELRVVLLTDGAPEMFGVLDSHLNPASLGCTVTRLLDFFHLLEKLGKAAAVAFGEAGPEQMKRWRASLLNSTHTIGHIREALRRSGTEYVQFGDSRPVHEAITYLNNQADRMDYPAARRAGLPIGSGNVEAACKSLVDVRMKRPGSRWKEHTGQHILDLRSLALSKRLGHALELTISPLRKEIRAAA